VAAATVALRSSSLSEARTAVRRSPPLALLGACSRYPPSSPGSSTAMFLTSPFAPIAPPACR